MTEAVYLANALGPNTRGPLQPRDSFQGSVSVKQAGQTHPIEMTDECLVAQLRGGDHGALSVLFLRYARMVRAVAYRII